MKKYKYPILTLLVVFALPLIAIAQDPGGGPDAPIDGGLSVLLAAGAAYGVKKYKDNKKKNNENSDLK